MGALRMMKPNTEADRQSAHELVLFIENDGDLYRGQHQSINKNLAAKKAKGVYDHAKAVKLFGYLAESGAKKYNKEFGGGGSVWREMFDVATRKQAAEELTNTFELEYDNGQFVHLLPKKYQKNPVAFRRENGTDQPSTRTHQSSTHWYRLGKQAAASGKYRDEEDAIQGERVPPFQSAPFTRGFFDGLNEMDEKRNPDNCEGDMIDDDEDEEQIDIDPDDDVDDGDDDDEYEDDILTQAQVELESDSLTIQCGEEGDYYIEDERTGQCWDVFDTDDGFEFEER